MRENKESKQVEQTLSEVIFSQESCSDQIDIVHQTFRRGGSTLKALE